MAMISRRKIISRSQSELDYSQGLYEVEEEVWFSKDKLFQDHITEILRKWDQIDDEIWGKIICMERNRRIAKAYSRVPVLTISGSEDGFDGYKIGLNGFENPMRDALTKTVKSHIGRGVRLKMDDMGNIIIKRMSNCDVFIRGWDRESNSLSKDIIELSGELEFEKSVKLFDMKKFQAGIARELLSAYPDRRKLENQCICAIAFVKDAPELLDLCSWVMLINIVALDLLKSRFPAMLQNRGEQDQVAPGIGSHYHRSQPKFVSIFDHNSDQSSSRETGLHRSISDEDPYSIPLPSLPVAIRERSSADHHHHQQQHSTANNNNNNNNAVVKSGKGKTSSSDPKPPELPPRDFAKIKKSKTKNLPQAIKSLVKNGNKNGKSGEMTAEEKRRIEIEYEDPYYCGLQARVPNFAVRPRKSMPAAVVSASGHYGGGGGGGGNESDAGLMMQRSSRTQHNPHQRSSSQHAGPASQLEIRKSQSSGYLNTLFNQSSSLFSSKKLDPQNKRNSASFNSNPYSDSSLESDGYGISSGSGYDIYAPLSTPLYGRLRAQLHTNGSSGNGSHPNGSNNKNSSNSNAGINNVSSRTSNNKSKNSLAVSSSSNNNNGISNGKNNSSNSSNGSNNHPNERMTGGGGVGGGNYRNKNRLEVLAYERTERYASSWD